MDSTLSEHFPFKIDWYQSEKNVFVVVFKKNEQNLGVRILEQTERLLELEVIEKDKTKHRKVINLSEKIAAEAPSVNVQPAKIEIKLKKAESVYWCRLEEPKTHVDKSKKPKNWDEVAKTVGDEPLEGEDKLNKFFRDIYYKGSDETKKAMIKSFTESAGTELSTNWDAVEKKTVDIKPPDGLEWKSWD